jgi:hypothetical protein
MTELNTTGRKNSIQNYLLDLDECEQNRVFSSPRDIERD